MTQTRINPGRLNRWLHIQTPERQVEPSGAATESWSLGFNVRAELVQRQTDDHLTAAGDGAECRVTFLTRYFTNIAVGDRLTYDGGTYQISGIAEIGMRRGLEIKAIGQNTRFEARRNDRNVAVNNP